MTENAPYNATYFREYGTHPVKRQDNSGHDYIASYPNWDELAKALKSDFPSSGNIITPEYIAAPDDLYAIKDSAKLIDDRIRKAAKLTKRSDATLYLGTPTHGIDSTGNTAWYNSVLALRHGQIESATHKSFILPIEKEFGIDKRKQDLRKVKMGNAVLICAELYAYADDLNNPLRKQNPRQIFAPTAWAIPARENANIEAAHKRAGGEDSYYRKALELSVGSFVLKDLPSVDRVIVSDRGRPDLPPYNAVFDRSK